MEEEKENRVKKVFIVNDSGHDFRAAERYGELVVMTKDMIPRTAVRGMYNSVKEFLDDSHPDDWIILTSLTTICSVVCAYFGYLHGRLNLLIHISTNRPEGKYIQKNLVFRRIEEENG